MSSKKTVLVIGVMVALIVGLFASTASAVYLSRELVQEKAENNIAVSDLNQRLSESVENEAVLSESVSVLEEKYVNLKDENDRILKELRDEQRVSRQLLDKYTCPEAISWDVDYSSNHTVSESLKRWVEELYSVNSATYEPIWSNSKTAYHKVYGGEFLFPYIVYFDESYTGYKQGVFSIGLECWID